MKLYCTLNNQDQINVNIDNGQYVVDGKVVPFQLTKLGQNNYQLIKENKSYSVSVISFNKKTALLNINGSEIEVAIKNELEVLLATINPKAASADAVNEVVAPMPGTILDVLVVAGQQVIKGDALLILNAMKMENVIKSPNDSIVLDVHVAKDQNVNKSDVLITLQ